MNYQQKLMQLAEAHQDSNPAIRSVLLDIKETQYSATVSLHTLKASADVLKMGVALEDGYGVSLSSDDLIMQANKAAVAMALMARYFMMLESLLGAAGVSADS